MKTSQSPILSCLRVHYIIGVGFRCNMESRSIYILILVYLPSGSEVNSELQIQDEHASIERF